MPVSADLVQISIARETAYGEAPTTNASWYVLPITSEGVAASAETTLSNIMTPKRQVVDSLLNNLSAEGNIDSEMVICEALQIILESAMAADPVSPTPDVGTDPANIKELDVGLLQKSFSIQKRFPDPKTVPSGDGYLYQLITGAVANTFAVTVSPSEAVTYSVGIMGKDFIPSAASIYSGDPGDPDNSTVLRAPDSIELQFGSVVGAATPNAFDGEDITSRCFGDFGFTINNNYRGIQCIGTLGYSSVAIGRCEVEATGTIHLKDNALLDALKSQEEVSVTYRVQSADDPITKFNGMFGAFFPRCKFSADPVVAGGTGTDVVNDATLNALYHEIDETTATLIWGFGDVA